MRIIAIIASMFFLSISYLTQGNEMYRTAMIGETAPAFSAHSTQGVTNFPHDLSLVLFF
jgi:hypothetical protein